MSNYSLPNYNKSSNEESLSTQVYNKIKQKILNLEYPPGSSLTEARLAEEYNVSRMPVRIATRNLCYEGLLVSDFRRKLRVKEITKKSIEEIYELREIFETRALQKIFDDGLTWDYSFLIEEKLLRMKAASMKAAQNDYFDYLCADSEIHFTLISVFHNEKLEEFYSQLCDDMVRICTLLYNIVSKKEGYIDSVIKRLEELVSAIRSKNYEASYECMSDVHFNHKIDGLTVAEVIDRYYLHSGASNSAKK